MGARGSAERAGRAVGRGPSRVLRGRDHPRSPGSLRRDGGRLGRPLGRGKPNSRPHNLLWDRCITLRVLLARGPGQGGSEGGGFLAKRRPRRGHGGAKELPRGVLGRGGPRARDLGIRSEGPRGTRRVWPELQPLPKAPEPRPGFAIRDLRGRQGVQSRERRAHGRDQRGTDGGKGSHGRGSQVRLSRQPAPVLSRQGEDGRGRGAQELEVAGRPPGVCRRFPLQFCRRGGDRSGPHPRLWSNGRTLEGQRRGASAGGLQGLLPHAAGVREEREGLGAVHPSAVVSVRQGLHQRHRGRARVHCGQLDRGVHQRLHGCEESQLVSRPHSGQHSGKACGGHSGAPLPGIFGDGGGLPAGGRQEDRGS
mmetsp:Transcript_2252/g.6952  ORF Transcript_2252/g.6952 Transcript_2252/m.6952 type:complete len:365 (-) Transcript_2252:1387-2481(-)